MIEGQPLTLMDSDGPRQSQGQLFKGSLHLGLNLARLLIQGITSILPFQWLHLDCLIVAFAIDGEFLLANLHHAPNLTIIKAMLTRRIVLHKHYLSALFQYQCLGCRIGIVRERALDFCVIGIGMTWQLLQFRFVVEISQVIVCG